MSNTTSSPAKASDQIITIKQRKISKEKINTVNARDLHEFLESKKDYSSWIKARIKQYAFVENEDFIIITQTGDNYKRGPKFKNYHLTIDMAKELSMVERTEKGRQARRYFIECEKIAKDTVKKKKLKGKKIKRLPAPQRTYYLPLKQAREISKRINRVMTLFHPLSEQFADMLGISRALAGLDPNLGLKADDFVKILPEVM